MKTSLISTDIKQINLLSINIKTIHLIANDYKVNNKYLAYDVGSKHGENMVNNMSMDANPSQYKLQWAW